MIIKKQHEQEL